MTDSEGCFIIGEKENYFYFRFDIYMHKDDSPMLKYISDRLNIGSVYVIDHFVCLSVVNPNDLIKIFSIFDNSPLNTSKNLNYLLFKEAFELYSNRKSLNFEDVKKEITGIKDQMNKKRVDFNQPENHFINITPYWLIGFVEAEGYFSVASNSHKLTFGIGQSATELNVLEAIKEFFIRITW